MLLHGDCLERLRELPACSVDACVTDPPYGLSFMGKKWDYDVPGEDIWRECLRVLKPGGHLLAFAGTRTQHRMAVRIEDAGFEIRDMIAWVYGSGFPKSHNISKAIDKAAGAERQVIGISPNDRPKSQVKGGKAFDRAMDQGQEHAILQITAPATPEAQQWDGWGTALKPALEPITVARKPFKGTVAANVLEHGTGAINIDGCRVGTSKNVPASVSKKAPANCYGRYAESGETPGVGGHDPNIGRWPANLIHDGSDEVTELFPQTTSGGFREGTIQHSQTFNVAKGVEAERVRDAPAPDSGSAARFFYCAKASKADRSEGNTHPTVKPTDLMRYLCRLVTPPGGIVLDPFMGSGSTGKAAMLDGFRFIGIEREAEYLEIAKQRMQEPTQTQGTLL
jgi:DNA modification methylase